MNAKRSKLRAKFLAELKNWKRQGTAYSAAPRSRRQSKAIAWQRVRETSQQQQRIDRDSEQAQEDLWRMRERGEISEGLSVVTQRIEGENGWTLHVAINDRKTGGRLVDWFPRSKRMFNGSDGRASNLIEAIGYAKVIIP